MPPQSAFHQYLSRIWESEWLTNNGPLVLELEEALEDYLGYQNLLFVSNGTIALQMAVKALELHGEIITTPFTFIATTTSILWEGCRPVFADVCPDTWNIDAEQVESLICEDTVAIVATHVFGNPCNVEDLQALADRHQLKLIYDAAHAFGVRYRGQPLINYGDVSAMSFHATKLFHTVEGGAVTAGNQELLLRLSNMRNFGYAATDTFSGIGINGKNSEFHAAMGLCVLPYMNEILAVRKAQYEFYQSALTGHSVRHPLRFQRIQADTDYNHAYMPVLFENTHQMLRVKSALEAAHILPRRYFYPALSHVPYLQSGSMPVAESLAPRILCLPLYHSLPESIQQKIVNIILTHL